ncbi:DUF2306 domain-containing protein [Solimonas sp. K1W22B-7]|uniref:DUF2306 domain-containing protein n=1 Tax=Solimonas sp. K1W22B-7 TaxID=2303331 RepID=UPI000E32DCC4|nr:DUF2306 domain-containing protein [Solimonas sp. K1W22B-7]AXQ27961.1 DUF2306 domain-containing protein [Solimonas sp. K1W22B-7]
MDTQKLLIYFHLVTVMPALVIGTYILLKPKGTPSHRLLGKWYMSLLIVTALASFFMQAQVGPRLFNHFGYIHLVSVLTLYSVPMAYYTARKRNVKRHKRLMVLTYIGAVVIAGLFALFTPGRVLYSVLFA